MDKYWKNHWICEPAFLELEPIKVLFRQVDAINRTVDRDAIKAMHREDLRNIHTLFRKEFLLDKVPEKVYLDISADDFYKLYINGKYVTQGPAQSYPFYYYFNRLDVTEYLEPGENVIAVHVYYQGLINRAYNSGDYRQGMIAEMIAVETNHDIVDDTISGRHLIDDNWKFTRAEEYSTTGTSEYLTQFTEHIDNRKKRVGWKEKGYDDSLWELASKKHNIDYRLVVQETKNVVVEKQYPVKINELSDGYIMDFGENVTGTFYMKARGHAGTQVQILFGEELTENGTVRSKTRCNCIYEDSLILEEGVNELEQYDYKCFRYVQLKYKKGDLSDKNDIPILNDFRVDFRHYPFDDSKQPCVSEQKLVQDIWKICKNAVKLCAQEQLVDCPHREKGQYIKDIVVSGHAYSVLTGDTVYLKKVIIDFANSTRICKGMLCVAPGNQMNEIADYSLDFAYLLLLYYHLSKDEVFLRNMLPVAEGVESYFDKFKNAAGLIENVKTKNNIVDWPPNMRDDYDFDISTIIPGDGCHNVVNAMYYGTKLCIEKIKDILCIPYENQTKKLKESLIDNFYHEETGLFTDTPDSNHSAMHSNIFMLFFGIAPKGNKIAESFRKRGFKCNVAVAYYALYGLMRAGETELAYEMIINKSEQSWYNMLQEGATTGFEAWGKEQKWNTSLCHGWSGAPIPVLVDMQKKNWDWLK